jgi:hypothetical protein
MLRNIILLLLKEEDYGRKNIFFKLAVAFYNSDTGKKIFRKKQFLNYDVSWLIDNYSAEPTISSYIPYKEEICWLQDNRDDTFKRISEIEVVIEKDRFRLKTDGNSDLRAFQGEALGAFKKQRKMTSDETIIHLEKVEHKKGCTRLFIQPARYSDQVQSNLVVDWEGPHTLSQIGKIKTLRSFLSAKYGKNLPPLHDHRLANTLGISVVILYKENGNYFPYLPLRIGNEFKDLLKKTGRSPKQVAVFEGGYTCTASGAAQWGPGDTFKDSIEDDIYNELREEVGILKEHIDLILPVALCREFLRAGKPQLFFIGVTNQTKKELDVLRAEAIRHALKIGAVPELHDAILSNNKSEMFYENLKTKGINFEAAANLFYVDKFIDLFLKD